MARVTELLVNGGRRRIDVDSDRTLLSVLRDDLDLTGTKYGCGEGQCAACTVLVNGVATKACLTKVGATAGKRIVTISISDNHGFARAFPYELLGPDRDHDDKHEHESQQPEKKS